MWCRRELKRSNVTGGLHRLIRRIKGLSHSLFHREELVEVKSEMEIGYPTDVKHVTHIGLDGSITANQDMAWIQTQFFHVRH
ncbi:hypothetical protein QN277_007639 [Acacia crassicarpa]|uniref:CRIB domain-containing protein n=1 Tax=Acacia crassicarpa TaxID=499986 RepID=A0AAE1M908_9FABA|nr:hypothetical protein QN277_007639 [Acacia crassicarpa]